MLKTVVESLDGLDEPIAKLYAQDGDRFVLQLDGVDDHPDVANLRNAYSAEKTRRQKALDERDSLKAKLADLPEDFDPEQWRRAKDGKADPEQLVQLRQELEGKMAEAQKRAEAAETKLRTATVERSLDEALAANGITDPAFQRAARALISPQVQVGEDGRAVVDTDMGPLPLTDYAKRWTAGEGKAFVTPPSGGGARGNEGTTSGKSITRAEYDKLPVAKQREVALGGTQIVD